MLEIHGVVGSGIEAVVAVAAAGETVRGEEKAALVWGAEMGEGADQHLAGDYTQAQPRARHGVKGLVTSTQVWALEGEGVDQLDAGSSCQ